MKKHLLLILALVFVAFSISCNKQKPHKLDYGQKLEKGMYNPDKGGLPGDSKIGPTDMENSYHGFHKVDGAADHQGDEQTDAKKPDETKADDKKADDKKADDKKAGE